MQARGRTVLPGEREQRDAYREHGARASGTRSASTTAGHTPARRSHAHERLRSGSVVGRAAYATSAAFCLAALLATEGGADAVPPAVAVGLFALGFCNVHAALSSEDSHWASAPASAVALAGNAAVWSQQLAALSMPAVRAPCASVVVALDRAIAAWRLGRFGATLTMWQLAVVALLLLKFEARFHDARGVGHIYVFQEPAITR